LDTPSKITFPQKESPLDLNGLLPDVITPLSFDIDIEGGIITAFIQGGNVVPMKKSQVFSTSSDNQSSMPIDIYRGERASAKDNDLLGNFEITGIPPARGGDAVLEVVFEVDVNGILKVSATERVNGKTNGNDLQVQQV
jgi:molecular chaperone DnaK (HSP70)